MKGGINLLMCFIIHICYLFVFTCFLFIVMALLFNVYDPV
ncbi:Uncharacterised protein [Enterobacter cloacae]|nr:Uncharacterised protein [Enterobacter cloacae]